MCLAWTPQENYGELQWGVELPSKEGARAPLI